MAAATFLEESQKKEEPVLVPDEKKSQLLSTTTTGTNSGGGIPTAAVASNSSTTTRNMKNNSPMPRDWLVQLLQKYNANNDKNNDNNMSSHDDILTNKALVVAPMVDQSDLPFRLLCRRYGANLCYTPMIHARMFVNNEQGYRTKFWKKQVENEDRPLIVQFAGGDPSVLARAAKIVQGQCDAIDLNCGCPQSIAKRGNYGSYLLEQEELLLQCIRSVRQAVPDTPITVKVRLLPTTTIDDTTTTTSTATTTQSLKSCISASISLYLKLIEAGVSLITVHGRNRFQKGNLMGSADWYAIQQVVQACGPYVPIIANGSCASLQDVQECLRVTGADGVMLSEAILEYPPIFLPTSHGREEIGKTDEDEKPQEIIIRTGPGRLQIAREYMDLCFQYPPQIGGQGSGIKCIKMHLHRFLHTDLQLNTDLRDLACRARTYQDMVQLLDAVQTFHNQINHQVKYETLTWYMRYRNTSSKVNDTTGINGHTTTSTVAISKLLLEMDSDEDDDDDDDKGASFATCLFGTDEEEEEESY